MRPEVWGEAQERAIGLSLLRFTLLNKDLATSGDVDKAILAFRDARAWWLVMHRAAHDIVAKQSALSIETSAAQAMLMADDLRDPKATALRVRAQLDEDIADNPWIRDGLK
jgi:hypothetical protein